MENKTPETYYIIGRREGALNAADVFMARNHLDMNRWYWLFYSDFSLNLFAWYSDSKIGRLLYVLNGS